MIITKTKVNRKHVSISAMISSILVAFLCIAVALYFYPDKILRLLKVYVGAREVKAEVKLYPDKVKIEVNPYHDRDAILAYMRKHSKVSISYLEDIYNKVKGDNQKLLLLAMMKEESHYNPLAESKVARGLMEIHKINWKTCAEQGFIPLSDKKPDDRELFDISANIDCGKYILNVYLEDAKDIRTGLKHYVLGPNSKAKTT